MWNKIKSLDAKIGNITFFAIFVVVLFVTQMLLALQGLSLGDEGFVLTCYQQIFSNPETINSHFGYYLGIVVGGIWNYFFSEYGIMGFRFFSIFISVTIASIVYFSTKDIINRWIVFLGSILLVFISGSVGVFHHNLLSCLFATSAGCLLYKGLLNDKTNYVLISGLLLGINVFTRLPNVSLFGISLVLIPYYFYDRNFKSTIKHFATYTLGFLVGIGLIIGLIYSLKHEALFADCLNTMADVTSQDGNSHGILNLIRKYSDTSVKLLFNLLEFFIPSILLILAYNKISDGKIAYKIAICTLLLLYLLKYRNTMSITFVNSFVLFAYILVCINYYNDKKILLLYTIGFLISFLQPLGSDLLFDCWQGDSIRLSFPLSLWVFCLLTCKPSFKSKFYVAYCCIFLAFFTVYCVWNKCIHFNYGMNNRVTMTAKPDINHFNVYLAEDEANTLNQLQEDVVKYVKKDDYLLCVDCLPILYYATETKPYISAPWAALLSPSRVESEFKEHELRHDNLPVIVWSKSENQNLLDPSDTWNRDDIPNFISHNSQRIRIYKEFIKKHNYHIVKNTDYYTIFVTSE